MPLLISKGYRGQMGNITHPPPPSCTATVICLTSYSVNLVTPEVTMGMTFVTQFPKGKTLLHSRWRAIYKKITWMNWPICIKLRRQTWLYSVDLNFIWLNQVVSYGQWLIAMAKLGVRRELPCSDSDHVTTCPVRWFAWFYFLSRYTLWWQWHSSRRSPAIPVADFVINDHFR